LCIMKTVTLDILNDKAMNLLKELELLKLVRVRRQTSTGKELKKDLIAKYKGAMTPQSKDEIDRQLQDLRNEWE